MPGCRPRGRAPYFWVLPTDPGHGSKAIFNSVQPPYSGDQERTGCGSVSWTSACPTCGSGSPQGAKPMYWWGPRVMPMRCACGAYTAYMVWAHIVGRLLRRSSTVQLAFYCGLHRFGALGIQLLYKVYVSAYTLASNFIPNVFVIRPLRAVPRLAYLLHFCILWFHVGVIIILSGWSATAAGRRVTLWSLSHMASWHLLHCALIACISSHCGHLVAVLYTPSNSRKFIGRAEAASSHAGHMVSVDLAASGCYMWRSCVVVLLGRLAGRVRFGGTCIEIPCVLFDVGFSRLYQ